MSTGRLTAQDLTLRDGVIAHLQWQPAIDATGIGVTAHEGTVILTGCISTYAGKLAAQRAVSQLRGVRAVANDLVVTIMAGRTDSDIAADAADALRVNAAIPDTVQVVVHHAQLTLTGTVAWSYQYLLAEQAVRHVGGIRHVQNKIRIEPPVIGRDIETRLLQALRRNARLDARRISVAVENGTARLTGYVLTHLQSDLAERVVFEAPGITAVDNQLVIDPPSDNRCDAS